MYCTCLFDSGVEAFMSQRETGMWDLNHAGVVETALALRSWIDRYGK